MPTPHLDTLRQRYLAGRLVLFAGAGVAQAGGLPSWPALIRLVLEYARANHPAPETAAILGRAAGHLEQGGLILALSELQRAMSSAAYGQAVSRALDDSRVPEVPPLARAIAALAPTLQGVVTTNLDRFLERAFAGAWPVYTLPQLDLGQRKHYILKLHGCRTDRNSWVFTRAEYDAVMHRQPGLHRFMDSLYLASTLLFVGYGLQDPDLDERLGEMRALAGGAPPQHFALMPRGRVDESRRRHLFEPAGVTVLEYDEADGHRALHDILAALAATQPSAAPPPLPPPASPWAGRREPPPPPARVLLVAANPAETVRLRLDAEAAAIDAALRASEHRDALQLRTAWAVDLDRLLDACLRHGPHVLQFSGHGEHGGARLEGAVLDPAVLGDILAELPDLRCVVLNACESDAHARALTRHVPCVVAMHGPVSDDGAQAFASAFYPALGYGRSLGVAFRLGRAALGGVSPGARETPPIHAADEVDVEQVKLVRVR